MSKKICYVVTIPLTIKAFFVPQIRYLSNNGFDVTVVCSRFGSDDAEVVENQLNGFAKIHYIDMPRGLSLFGSIKAIHKLKRFFKKEKFDLIQYSTPNASLYASTAALFTGCKIRNYHLMGFRFLGEKGIYGFILKLMEKITCLFSTNIECVSRSNLELGLNLKIFNEKKATVVWNGSSGGVDCKRFDIKKREAWRAGLRKDLGYLESDFIYGYVGRITRDKGINELIEAFLSLNNGAKLFIIGNYENDGSVDSALWDKALHSENIRIHGPTDEIEKYYALIDVLVFPSHREGFGNVIIEAAAVGTPAVVADIPGPRDCVVAGKTGWFFSLSEKSGLANSMKKVKNIDCLEFGKNAEDFVKNNFDSEVLCKKICDRKHKLLSR